MNVQIGLLVEATVADVALKWKLTAVNTNVLVVVDGLRELLAAVLALVSGVFVRQHVHADLSDNLQKTK